jgi:hypothetical protein
MKQGGISSSSELVTRMAERAEARFVSIAGIEPATDRTRRVDGPGRGFNGHCHANQDMPVFLFPGNIHAKAH